MARPLKNQTTGESEHSREVGERIALFLKGREKLFNRTTLCRETGINRSNYDKYIHVAGKIPFRFIPKMIELIKNINAETGDLIQFYKSGQNEPILAPVPQKQGSSSKTPKTAENEPKTAQNSQRKELEAKINDLSVKMANCGTSYYGKQARSLYQKQIKELKQELEKL